VLTIANLSAIAASSSFNVYVRVSIPSYINYLQVFVSVSYYSAIPTTAPFYGYSSKVPTRSASGLITNIYGSGAISNQIEYHSSGTDTISVTVTFTNELQYSSSTILDIYASTHVKKDASWSSSSSCTGFTPCGIDYTTYTYATYIKIDKANAFSADVSYIIPLTELKLDGPSSNEQRIYEFFFKIRKDSTASSVYFYDFSAPMVVCATSSDIVLSFVNDLMPNTYYNYPNLLNIVIKATTVTNYALTASQKNAVVIYASQPFNRLFTT
jgi:hypothetical protein